MKLLPFFILSFFLLATRVLSQDHANPENFPYDLTKMSRLFILPESLEEVSGLTYYAPNQLACINDEQGKVYIYDYSKKEIVKRFRFEGSGDFEGVELVGDHLYAIKSNGDLYRFNINMSGVVEKIPGPFDSENNIEGLGYDKEKHTLLIALKDKGDIKNVEVKGKAIYGYDLGKEAFTRRPLYVLMQKDLERVLGGSKRKIKPSGVAVHPISGETYVLAAKGRALMVFHKDGKPKNLSLLAPKYFPQPEGICFAPNGDLFISNEGDGEEGNILLFEMKSL